MGNHYKEGPRRPGVAKASQTRRSRYYILVTIRLNHKRFISMDELYEKYLHIKSKLTKYGSDWSDNIGYELTKGNVLHLHTYVVCCNKPWYKSDNGWNIQFKEFPLEDIKIIIDYINKQPQTQAAREQRETESKIYNLSLTELFI